MRVKRIIFSLALVILLSGLSYGEWIPEKIYNPFTGISSVVETPHLVWGKPHMTGTIKVLVIGPAWGHRESVEMMQRFDLDVEVIMTHTHNYLSSEDSYGTPQFWTISNVTDEFDAKLKKEYDVIVIGRFEWDKILTKHRYEILKKVYGGTGLVYVSPPRQNRELDQLFKQGVMQDIEVLTRGIPAGRLTAFKDRDAKTVFSAGAFGKGRWVALRYTVGHTNHILTPGIHPYEKDWEYEYYTALVARAIQWASERDKGITLTGIPSDTLMTEDMPATVKILFDNATTADSFSIDATLCRERDGSFIDAGTTDIKDARGSGQRLGLNLPVLSEGQYIVNLIFRSGGKVCDWAAFPLSITSRNSIEKIDVDRICLRANEEVSGGIILKQPLAKGYTLQTNFYDNHGRLLWEKRYSETGKEKYPFRFGAGTPYRSSVHHLEAVLKKGSVDVSLRQTAVSVTGRERPAFPVSIWSEPQADYISKRIFDRYPEISIDARFINIGIIKHPGLAEVIAESNLFTQPSYPQYWGRTAVIEQTEKGPVHKNCLHNPDVVKERAERATEIGEHWSRYDVLVYGDGSDRSMGGNCFCEYTLQAFREWLKSRYKNIGNLNRIWNTIYNRWEDIIPATLKKAKEQGSYTSWLEHTRFMEESYAKDMGVMRDALRESDKDALMGPDGYGRLNSTDGADWWKILGTVGYYNLYTYQDPPQLEITRSLAAHFPNVKYRTIYWGSYTGQFTDGTFMRYFPWYALLHNYNGIYWWTADGKTTYGGANAGIIAPDLRITYPFYLSQQGIRKIKDGIFHIIDGAQRYNSGIAIHYGKTAIYAADAYRSTGYYVASCTGTEKLLEDMGYQYDYVASEQVETGILKNFKVLILPFTLALSDKEALEIEQFVRNGGILIAGEKPAQYDYYLRKAVNGSLLHSVISQPGRLHRTGSGISLIMDKDITGYPKQRMEKQGKEFRDILYGILRDNGVHPIATIPQFIQETGIPMVEVVRYDKNGMSIISFINYRDGSASFEFTPQMDRYVYEVTEGNTIGANTPVNVKLDGGGVKMYALLPSQVKGLEVYGPASVSRGKDYEFSADSRLSTGETIQSVYRYSLTCLGGKKATLYSGVFRADEEGLSKASIPFAFNDTTGRWLLEVEDVISGVKVTKEVQLK